MAGRISRGRRLRWSMALAGMAASCPVLYGDRRAVFNSSLARAQHGAGSNWHGMFSGLQESPPETQQGGAAWLS